MGGDLVGRGRDRYVGGATERGGGGVTERGRSRQIKYPVQYEGVWLGGLRKINTR